mmetsp:Transcript_96647/g.297961  ORF Transcript_96647/g.297961 Transcript_96647/m.297961 type:complete len:273 (+) Transcript_96647:271-1089(+)
MHAYTGVGPSVPSVPPCCSALPTFVSALAGACFCLVGGAHARLRARRVHARAQQPPTSNSTTPARQPRTIRRGLERPNGPSTPPSPSAPRAPEGRGDTASSAVPTYGARPTAATKTPQPNARAFARLHTSRAKDQLPALPTSARAAEAAESAASYLPAFTRRAAAGSSVTSATMEPSRSCETLSREGSMPAARARRDSRSVQKAARRSRTNPKSAVMRSTTRCTWDSGASQVGPTRVSMNSCLPGCSRACSSDARGSTTLPSRSAEKGSEAR